MTLSASALINLLIVSILDIALAQSPILSPSASPPPGEKSWSELSPDELIVLSKKYQDEKSFEISLKAAQAALAKSTQNAVAKALEGEALLMLNRDQEAILSFREAIKFNPKIENGYLGLAKYYLKPQPKIKNFQPNWSELRLLYLDLVKSVGENPKSLALMCEAAFNDGIYEQAATFCQKAIRADLKNPENFLFLGQTYQAQGQSKKATEYFKRAAASFPKSLRAQLLRAEDLDREKNSAEASKFYITATELEPNQFQHFENAARTLSDMQKYREALPFYKVACDLNVRKILPQLRKTALVIEKVKQPELTRMYNDQIKNCMKKF
jgi:tetratricopeptide (TPR) repeat protein